MKNYSKEVFLQKLSEIPFPNYTNFECVSAAYEDFVNKLLGVIDMVCQGRTDNCNTSKPLDLYMACR